MEYTEAGLVRIAQRERNRKRNYLVVNRLQGKHIPAEPGQALAMFGALADVVKKGCQQERLLVVGFAETATAIGAEAAAKLGAYYIQTTRENVQGAGYLFFSEEHSHATEQRLVRNGLQDVVSKVDRIVFAEDEVTTGKTILNIINLLEGEFPGQAKYAVASILNGMGEESLAIYRDREIPLYYLIKTDHAAYVQQAGQYAQKGEYFDMDGAGQGAQAEEIKIGGWVDARQLLAPGSYIHACGQLWHAVDRTLHDNLKGSVLVLGTEEFMYPALFVADKIGQAGAKVRFHATTRSPIAVYKEAQYPLHTRYGLCSVYDKDRKVYLYDIGAYDTVLILTDAQGDGEEGVRSLIQAVSAKNRNIYFIRWVR